MKKILFTTSVLFATFAFAGESKVEIVGDTVISRDASLQESKGNLDVEGTLSVGGGAVQIAPNGDVVITGRMILKNPDGGISMGSYGRHVEVQASVAE